MAISGLVLTLVDDVAFADVHRKLSADPRLTLGQQFGRRLAVVAETPGVSADRDLVDELRGTAGITHVDVIYVHLDNDPTECTKSVPRSEEEANANR